MFIHEVKHICYLKHLSPLCCHISYKVPMMLHLWALYSLFFVLLSPEKIYASLVSWLREVLTMTCCNARQASVYISYIHIRKHMILLIHNPLVCLTGCNQRLYLPFGLLTGPAIELATTFPHSPNLSKVLQNMLWACHVKQPCFEG